MLLAYCVTEGEMRTLRRQLARTIAAIDVASGKAARSSSHGDKLAAVRRGLVRQPDKLRMVVSVRSDRSAMAVVTPSAPRHACQYDVSA